MTEQPLSQRVTAPASVAEPRHPDVATWRSPTADDVDAIHALIVAADTVDHPTWATPRDEIEDLFDAAHIDPARDLRVGFDGDGRAIALGVVMIHPSRDVHVNTYLMGRVHPDVRGLGIGRDVLRWEHESALSRLASMDASVPAGIFVYIDEVDTAGRRLAERRGFALERWFSSMVRDLALEAPSIDVPDGIDVVAFERRWSESTRLARNDAFRDHWGSLETPADRWTKMIEGPHHRDDLSFVAVDGDRVVALALGSVNEDDWEMQGYSSVYIELIGVVRDHRGMRLAPAVITALLRAARDAGLDKAVLDVDTESPTGANSLYGRLGFEATERAMALVARV
ncbi:GNAT family N-acetyltransferase [Microbacterium awajiense]|uniref:GNAT family N-acetyltransferase n=1 Tax=Microbacterium awajiense TaxID=415214 RepID=A0ABP7AI30_9MICO